MKIKSDEFIKASYWWNCLSRKHQGDLIKILQLPYTGYNELSKENLIKAYRQCPNKDLKTR